VLRIANANMERAIRVVSVERGYDPRDFALVAFGGCGGLHACEIAAQLGIRTVVVPRLAGALSALGMLIADRVRDYAAGALGRSDHEALFRELEAANELRGARLERRADVRYKGQSYELTVPWNARNPAKPFHAAHHQTYGYSDPARAIEIVTLRVRARVGVPAPRLTGGPAAKRGRPESRPFHTGGRWVEAAAWQREQIGAKPTAGPALVLDYGSTTLIPEGWRFRLDRAGSLIVSA
jgi:N-methylhydantoinase A